MVARMKSKLPFRFGERGLVVLEHDPRRADRASTLLLLARRGEHRHIGPHGARELDRHVAEAAEADDADLMAGALTPQCFSGE